MFAKGAAIRRGSVYLNGKLASGIKKAGKVCFGISCYILLENPNLTVFSYQDKDNAMA
jgi:hypothetical protein